MRTAHRSSRPGGTPQSRPPQAGTCQIRHPPRTSHPKYKAPPGPGTPGDQAPPAPWIRHPPRQIPLNFPLGCGTGSDPPLTFPLGVGLDQIPLNFPLDWAWTRSPSTSPLGVGLETPWRLAARHAGIPPAMHAGIAPPLENCWKACWDTTCNECWDSTPYCGQTHTCKHITLPQTSFAGGYNLIVIWLLTYQVA